MKEFDFENLPTGHVRTVVFFMADDGIQVLLVRRKYPPFDNKLALPGGFVKTNSTTEERARERPKPSPRRGLGRQKKTRES